MKKHAEARLEDATIDHLTTEGGYVFVGLPCSCESRGNPGRHAPPSERRRKLDVPEFEWRGFRDKKNKARRPPWNH